MSGLDICKNKYDETFEELGDTDIQTLEMTVVLEFLTDQPSL